MNKIPAMVDMRRTPAEKTEATATADAAPDYPWGLSISLGKDELEKLGLTDEVEVGDMLHVHALGKVTSVSTSSDETSGKCCRVEVQLTHMVGEDEDSDDENDEPVLNATARRSKLYGTRL